MLKNIDMHIIARITMEPQSVKVISIFLIIICVTSSNIVILIPGIHKNEFEILCQFTEIPFLSIFFLLCLLIFVTGELKQNSSSLSVLLLKGEGSAQQK